VRSAPLTLRTAGAQHSERAVLLRGSGPRGDAMGEAGLGADQENSSVAPAPQHPLRGLAPPTHNFRRAKTGSPEPRPRPPTLGPPARGHARTPARAQERGGRRGTAGGRLLSRAGSGERRAWAVPALEVLGVGLQVRIDLQESSQFGHVR
jgi:hypothetical protein